MEMELVVPAGAGVSGSLEAARRFDESLTDKGDPSKAFFWCGGGGGAAFELW